MRPIGFLLLMAVAICGLSGCTVVSHLSEISTLQDYSNQMDEHQKAVNAVNQKYDALKAAIEKDGLKSFKSSIDIQEAFGDPILTKTIESNGLAQQRWLYRYDLMAKAKDKVYLYFDQQGQLLKYEKENIQW